MITVSNGRSTSFSMGRWTILAAVGLLAVLVAWCAAATVYFVFHDQLLATLMAHQSEMQYVYEDKIATLKTDLDRAQSEGLLDQRTLQTTLHDLAVRGETLSARAAALDSLVSRGLQSPGMGTRTAGALGRNPPPAPFVGVAPQDGVSDFDATSSGTTPAGDLRLDRPIDQGIDGLDGSDKRSDASPTIQSEQVASEYDRAESAQNEVVARLRDPMVQELARERLALAEAGLPASLWRSGAGSDVGGPFVPLSPSAGGSSFDANVTLLRDAIQQQSQLEGIVDHVPLRRPLEGPLEVTSTFGPRLDPFYGRPAMHTGIDLHEDTGDAVESTASGIVTIAGSEGGYGNMVEIDHGNGLATRYAHLSAINVVVHQKVQAGYVVGRVGSTGRATGPHLHYETRINGEPVDPARFLKAGATLFPG